MPVHILIYWVILACITTTSVLRWRQFSRADRWLAGLMIVTAIQEIVAYLLILYVHDNLASYHFFSPIELSLTGIYILEATPSPKRRKLSWLIAAVAIAGGVVNTVFLQPLTTFNSYYLLFESTAIILLSLWSLYKVMLREDDRPMKRTHFWLLILLLYYWSATFMSWGVYNVMSPSRAWLYNTVFVAVLSVANLVFYIGVAWTFLRYNKLIPSGE